MTKRQIAAQKTKMKIFKAVADCFIKYGYYDTTIEQIAKTAGVAKGTVYCHFASKEDILMAIYSRYDENFITAYNGLKEYPEEEWLFRFFSSLYQNENEKATSVEIVKAVYSIQLYLPQGKMIFTNERVITKVLSQILERLHQKNYFREGLSHEMILDTLLTMIVGIEYKWCLSDNAWNRGDEINRQLNILLEGIRR